MPKVIGTVTHAFADYAYLRYIAGGEQARMRMAAWYARSSVRYGMRYGRVDAAPQLEGVAIWLPPGQTHLTSWRLARSGFMGVPWSINLEGIIRAIVTSAHMEREHERFAPGPHWYLFVLAVEPACQRQGIGGALLQPVLALADAAGQPCYLETHVESNVRFYQRHGFAVMSAVPTHDGKLTIYAMRRPGMQRDE